MKLKTRAMAMGLAALTASTGCVRNLPPPPAPAQEMPKTTAEVPPETEGQSRVIVDVTNGPARVEEVIAQASSASSQGVVAYGELTRNVCLQTPCAVNLDYGQHSFRFVSTTDNEHYSEAVVNANRDDSVFRHTMGEHSNGGVVHGLGATAAVLGVTGALVGGTLLLVGAASSSATSDVDPQSSSGSGLKTAGAVTLGISAAVLVLGIGMMIASPATNQDGSSTQFSLGSDRPSGAKRVSDGGHEL